MKKYKVYQIKRMVLETYCVSATSKAEALSIAATNPASVTVLKETAHIVKDKTTPNE